MAGPTRLVQLEHPSLGRRVALVDGDHLQLLGTYRSLYQFAQATLDTGYPIRDLLSTDLSGIVLDYPEVWALETEWQFLPSFDHPDEPARCIISDSNGDDDYKGIGAVLHGHGRALAVPDFVSRGADAATIAAAYVIDKYRTPRRVGLTPGNAFFDPTAHATPFPCSIGPELWIEAGFDEIRGSIAIRHADDRSWSGELITGERHLGRSLAQIETSVFRHVANRRPGDVHVHFFTAPASSYDCGILLEPGDEMIVTWDNFGRALANRVAKAEALLPPAAIPL